MENKFLVVVDIQPAYEDACRDIIYEAIEKINNTEQSIIFFYVGRKAYCDTKSDLIGYLLEHGLDEPKLDQIHFIEKDYGFFRSWMDRGISHQTILKTIKYMNQHKINDTKDFSDDDWTKTVGDKYSNLVFTEDLFCLPEFNQYIFSKKETDNFELIGGGRYECLLEIDFFLKGLGKTSTINDKLCYNRDDNKAKFHKKNKVK